ncbi:CARDB domain-containing protein [Thermodesulfitimonas autotrophica]|uniref:CARDB domain-containing protein n=1 Tax=Thermodesulfitimonas autotrophica TaxID=1894989 RepID=UPI002FE094EC
MKTERERCRLLGFLICLLLLKLIFAAPVLAQDESVKIKLPDLQLLKLQPDLTVSIAGPAKAVAGKSVSVKVTVKNNGLAAAPGTVDAGSSSAYMVDLVLSSDYDVPVKWAVQPVYAGKTKDDFVEDMLILGGRISNTKSISAGGQVSYTLSAYIPLKTSPGVYCLGAVVDSGLV